MTTIQGHPAGAGDERGATAVEYAIMAGLIALVIVGAVTLFGAAINGIFANAATLI